MKWDNAIPKSVFVSSADRKKQKLEEEEKRLERGRAKYIHDLVKYTPRLVTKIISEAEERYSIDGLEDRLAARPSMNKRICACLHDRFDVGPGRYFDVDEREDVFDDDTWAWLLQKRFDDFKNTLHSKKRVRRVEPEKPDLVYLGLIYPPTAKKLLQAANKHSLAYKKDEYEFLPPKYKNYVKRKPKRAVLQFWNEEIRVNPLSKKVQIIDLENSAITKDSDETGLPGLEVVILIDDLVGALKSKYPGFLDVYPYDDCRIPVAYDFTSEQLVFIGENSVFFRMNAKTMSTAVQTGEVDPDDDTK